MANGMVWLIELEDEPAVRIVADEVLNTGTKLIFLLNGERVGVVGRNDWYRITAAPEQAN